MTEEVNVDQTKADEKYYEVFLDLFTTDGWKQLRDELVQNHTVLNRVTGVKTEEVDYVKGQLNILTNLINLEDSTRFALEQMAENTDETD
jgi:pyruvate dehydrogenase complex dehydrogenase (E1) component